MSGRNVIHWLTNVGRSVCFLCDICNVERWSYSVLFVIIFITLYSTYRKTESRKNGSLWLVKVQINLGNRAVWSGPSLAESLSTVELFSGKQMPWRHSADRQKFKALDKALFLTKNIYIVFLFLDEALLISTHNICFRREVRKLFTWYPFLSRPMRMIWIRALRICRIYSKCYYLFIIFIFILFYFIFYFILFYFILFYFILFYFIYLFFFVFVLFFCCCFFLFFIFFIYLFFFNLFFYLFIFYLFFVRGGGS